MIKYLKLLNSFSSSISLGFKGRLQSIEWRDTNRHNFTSVALNVKDTSIITVGKCSYGHLNVESYDNREEKLVIGNYVSIAPNVTFILGGNHQIDGFSTYPLKSILIDNSPEDDAATKGPIIVEDEVWIGSNSIILSGVKIGRNSIIAAGSVITKNVEPFSIVGGNPAKFIKWRIPQELINERSSLILTKLNGVDIKKNIDLFYKPITSESLEDIKKIFK